MLTQLNHLKHIYSKVPLLEPLDSEL